MRYSKGMAFTIKTRRAVCAILILCMLLSFGCQTAKREMHAPETITQEWNTWDRKPEYLKLHMLDGGLYVLEEWLVTNDGLRVEGRGEYWDVHRAEPRAGLHQIPIANVALAETNRTRVNAALIGLAVLSVASLTLGVVCWTVDKACFGSCPTFYVEDGSGERMVAEGFSHSIAPPLEATDVDALTTWRPEQRDITVRMTNEAPETHVVRFVRLLAAPRNGHENVYQIDEERYRPGTPTGEMSSCSVRDEDCLDTLGKPDGVERKSVTDEHDLATKEVVALAYDGVPEDETLGLAVHFRQSFVTTFLLYQWLAYLGTHAVEALAEFTRSKAGKYKNGIIDELGRLEFSVRIGDEWVEVGDVNETGPLALETKLLELPAGAARDGRVEVRMKGAQGFWRVDHVGVVTLGDEVEPIAIEPAAVLRGGEVETEASEQLRSTSPDALVTLRGDAYELQYELPANPSDHRYFLQSRGYYLEWMRAAWLDDENLAMAGMMATFPSLALRVLAPKFKELEPKMEDAFWSSRFRPGHQEAP